jgi:hypothetical protein
VSQQAPNPIGEVLEAAGVRRIVAVDDMYANKAPVEDAIGAMETVVPETVVKLAAEFKDLDFDGDSTIREEKVRAQWPSLPLDRRLEIIRNLRAESSGTDDTDKKTAEKLNETFGALNFTRLALSEWKVNKDSILGDKTPLLILFDEDFEKEGGRQTEGLDVVAEILSTTSAESVMCALLSHKYPRTTDVHQQWEQLCKDRGFDKSRFVLIPKHYVEEDPEGFARLLKLATIAKPMDELRKIATDVLIKALTTAESEMNAIDIYDMDEIVFRSSWKEGVWEPETLLRVFALLHRTNARKSALANSDLHTISDRIRKLSGIGTDSSKAPEHRIWPIQRLEIYEDSPYINSLHLPIELGDIFEKSGGRLFVLIAPPCDLIVRSKGHRSDSMQEAILAEIIDEVSEERRSVTWELPYFQRTTKHYVDFKRTFSVRLCGLDLCVFNSDGSSALTVDEPTPKNLIPTWVARYSILQQELKAILKKIEGNWKSGNQQRLNAVRLFTGIDHGGVFAPTVKPSTGTLRYDFKRLTRLLAPRSNALLTSYGQFLARSAFEHDLERPRPMIEKTN